MYEAESRTSCLGDIVGQEPEWQPKREGSGYKYFKDRGIEVNVERFKKMTSKDND